MDPTARTQAYTESLKQTTRVLPHETDALHGANMHDIDSLFHLMSDVAFGEQKLTKQLVEWFAGGAVKPAMSDYERFFSELKALRAKRESLEAALGAIHAHERSINRLATQLTEACNAVSDLEKNFNKYLDRVEPHT